jgi:serine/threonine-protein kinase
MELLHGESLAARLATVGAMPADEVIRLLRPLMEAVVVAHDKGIVHRDIKPDNVLVGDRGDGVTRAVLLDFGMAKTNEAAWGHMTQSGVLVGTPYYMSPEQAEGAPDIGPATDVWSTGVMMYRALSGDLPFSASTPTALLLSIARGDHMPLSTRAPSVPAPIAAWVEGAIVVDRQKRYPDIRAMLAALDEALAGVVRPSRPDLATSQIRPAVGSSPRMPAALPVRSRAPMAIGAAVLALAAAMGAFFHFQASGPVAAPMPPTPVVAETGPEIVPTEPPPAPEAEAGEATTETSATETATDTVTEAAAATTPRTGREGRGARGGRGRDGTRGASASSGTGATTGSTSSGGSGLLTEW